MGEAAQENQEELENLNPEGDPPNDPPGGDEEHVEVVLEGHQSEEGKAPSSRKASPLVRDLRKRIKDKNKELRGKNRENEELHQSNESLQAEVARLNETLQTLNAGQQQQQPAQSQTPQQRPTLASCGYDTDLYEQQMEAWTDAQLDRKLDTRLGEAGQTAAKEQDRQKFETAVGEHYQRAGALTVPDYEDAEDAAARVMGVDLVQAIQATVDNSEMLLYWLGKNPDQAAEIKAIYDENPGKATFAMGALSSKLTLKPRVKSPPDPDLEVKGGGGHETNPAYAKFMDRLQDAYNNEDLAGARAVRKEAEEAGIDLPYNVAN